MSDGYHETASSAAIEHLRWSLTSDIGPILFARLIERFGSAQEALGSSARQLSSIEGIGKGTAESIARSRDGVDVRGEVDLAARHGVRILCREDDAYPPGLRHIPDAPICLYVRGEIESADAVGVGIVGSRRCTLYGREQARRFGYELGQRGVTVISGLARGIDGESHRGALEGGGRTLAVLGHGLATVYPAEHVGLAEEIVQRGALLSELPMSVSPEAKNFLPRNRIIAAMSLGVLVIEAARRSGSLTTARLATEYNRDVFALPGRVDSEFSRGTNCLIRDQQAKLVINADDILDELGDVGEILKPDKQEGASQAKGPTEAVLNALSETERCVLEALTADPQAMEVLADETELEVAQVASVLLSLQLKGLSRQLPGNVFIRIRG